MGRVSSEALDDLLVKTSRTFALSIPALPEPTRREVTLAYLLFRIADTLEDATRWTADRRTDELRRLGSLLSAPTVAAADVLARDWLADPPLDHAGYLELLGATGPVIGAFLELDPQSRQLVQRHLVRTVELMAKTVARGDGSVVELEDLGALREYCYAVAGIVGELLTELFLANRAELDPVANVLRRDAARFGEALQLVNILKDASSDAGEGRRFLPAAVDPREIFQLARADLNAARDYVLTLQRAKTDRGLVAFTALPILLARRTLSRVEAEGPGAKLTRTEVAELASRLAAAIDTDQPAIPEGA